MNIEMIVDVFVPPPGPVRLFNTIGPIRFPQTGELPLTISREDPLRLKSVLVCQDGQTHQLLIPEKDDDVVQNQDVGVTLPVVRVAPLVRRLETYIKAKKIASKVFAKMVLGVSASVFSNMKRKDKTLPRKELSEKELVIWGRVQFFLDNLATSTARLGRKSKTSPAGGKGKGKGRGRGRRAKGRKSDG